MGIGTVRLSKLSPGDSVAIVSPSFVAPAVFPAEYELGLSRLRDEFRLNPVEMPNVRNGSATNAQKMEDLCLAFTNPEIKAVITTIGGDSQIECVKHLPSKPFVENPKPFFGYSDNTHFANFLFLQGIPSYYGGCIYTEFAMQGSMDAMTKSYLQSAMFKGGTRKLEASPEFNDEDLRWGEAENLGMRRRYQPSEGWVWDGDRDVRGITWGGCLESVDELLRHGSAIPSLETFERVVLFLETCEETPPSAYVARVIRALGERGILSRVQGLLVGRPKAWSFEHPRTDEEKAAYKAEQRKTVLDWMRRYNSDAPVVQNMDFGHTAPTVCLPYGAEISLVSSRREIEVSY